MADPTYELDPYTLKQFCDTSSALFDEDIPTFIHFNLTGVMNQQQAYIELLNHRISDSPSLNFTTSRDYDSLIAVADDVLVRETSATIWPIAKYEDTLRSSLRVKYSFTNRQVILISSFIVPLLKLRMQGLQEDHLHCIPNLGVMKWGVHNLVRVLFPNLYGTARYVTAEQQADFYEYGMRPTLCQLLGDRAADLPPTVEAELIRARSWSGRLSLGSRTLPDYALEQFGDLLRQNLDANGIEWAQDLVFLHQIRGVKNTSFHPPASQTIASEAFRRFLTQNNIRYDDLLGIWCFVDVGLEISLPDGSCLGWSTDGHALLIQVFLEISAANARRITSLGSSKYVRDPLSHLMGASGFRITPGVRAEGPHEAAYIQAYSTDKSLTYAHESGHFAKFVTAAQILRGQGERFAEEMYRIYRAAAETNHSAARLEVRVPLEHASNVLLNPSVDLLRRSLLRFTPEEFW